MRYLFLDTESSNCFDNIYKLCEYGFVTADDSLNEIPGGKKDVLINPGEGSGSRFNLVGRKNSKDLVLAHSEEEYKAARYFDDHYDNLKFLLTQKDILIFFWAGENDIQAILDNCYRYRLPKINFVSYDVQVLYSRIMQLKSPPALEKSMEELGLSTDGITIHRPDDDAKMTLLTLKALCKKTGKSVKELIDAYPECKMESVPIYTDLQKRHKEKMERRKAAKARKEALAPFNNAFKDALNQDHPDCVAWEKTFSVTFEMKVHLDETKERIAGWIERGLFLRREFDVAYIVYYDETEREKLAAHLKLGERKLVSMDDLDALIAG